MSLYSISCELNLISDYADLRKALESYPHQHVMESYWLIESARSAEQIANHLIPHIGGNDALVVDQVSDRWTSFNTRVVSDNLRMPH